MNKRDRYPSSPIAFSSLPPYEYFLIDLGKNLLRARANVTRYELDSGRLSDMLGDVENYVFDNKIIYTDYDSFMYIVKKDWTNRMKFYEEAFDCDNFATAFMAHINEVWALNNVGLAIGKVVDINTNQPRFVHAWDVVLLGDNDTKKLFVFEPQAKILMPYDNPVINTLRYVPETILWW